MLTDRLSMGLVVRNPTMDDVEAVVAVMNACDIAEYGTADTEVADFRNDWERPGFDLSQDAWVVVTPEGQIVGYEEAEYSEETRHVEADGYVHPDYENRGIGTHLLSLVESWAAAQCSDLTLDHPIHIHATVSGSNVTAHPLFESLGYTIVRQFWRMEIEMKEAPLAPEWPAGIVVRPFRLGQDERIAKATMDEAFEDHWGFEPDSFEEWVQRRIARESFDPSLWFLAYDGNEVAGAILCHYRQEYGGWVRGLGVRRPWRQKGLGMALLRHALGVFYCRGQHTVGLGVDAQSLTGATRVYERAGMHVARHYDTYEKNIPSRSSIVVVDRKSSWV